MKPSEVVTRAIEALEVAFRDIVEVEGRIVAKRVNRWTNARGRVYEFVNLTLVDDDAASSSVQLTVTSTVESLERLLARSGLSPDDVTREGAVVTVTGHIRGLKNTGAPQLQLVSLAPAGLSADMLARDRVAARIAREGLGEIRREVAASAGLLLRVAVVGTSTGFDDVRHGFQAARRLPPPAACFHEIRPHSDTVVIDVPRLILDHVDRGVDAVLLAFGGHLPVPSPWDAEPVIDAIVEAHQAGVVVLAGFAHAVDRPLTKQVAVDLKQASAAGKRVVQRNDQRVEPVFQVARALPTAHARHDEQRTRLIRVGRRSAEWSERARTGVEVELSRRAGDLTTRCRRALDLDGTRIVRVARGVGRLEQWAAGEDARLVRSASSMLATVAGSLREADQLLRSRAISSTDRLNRELATGDGDVRSAVRQVCTGLAVRTERAAGGLRSASLVAEMIDRGWALVTGEDGLPTTTPSIGQRLVIRTASSRFVARVEQIESEEPHG